MLESIGSAVYVDLWEDAGFITYLSEKQGGKIVLSFLMLETYTY